MDRCPFLLFFSLGEFFRPLFQGTWFSVIYLYFKVPYLSSFFRFCFQILSSFFPSGPYFSLFCLSFSVSDMSASASLNEQCDRWNMTGEKRNFPFSQWVERWPANTWENSAESWFSCAEYSAWQESTQRDCTGDGLNIISIVQLHSCPLSSYTKIHCSQRVLGPLTNLVFFLGIQ